MCGNDYLVDEKVVENHYSFLFFLLPGYETDRPAFGLAPFGIKQRAAAGLQYTDARRGSGLPAELIDHAGTRREEWAYLSGRSDPCVLHS